MSDSIKYPLRMKSLRADLKKNAIQWASALPFVENKRAILIHRPKAATTHTLFKKPHISVEYFCGSIQTGNDKFTFLSVPPMDSVLCNRCEIAALEAGMPSADSLAGRHVHKGGMRAYTTCGHALPTDTSADIDKTKEAV